MAGMTDEPRGVSLDRTYGQLRAERALQGSRQRTGPTARLARQEQIERLLDECIVQLEGQYPGVRMGEDRLNIALEKVREARRLLGRL